MARNSTANPRTLFHLVPVPGNKPAQDALLHADNDRFVSPSAINTLGLEIGFHVPPYSAGNVITRLGRNTDLILRESLSRVHVAFEVHPVTYIVVISVRRKEESPSVSVISGERGPDGNVQEILGDCAIIYGRPYRITIASYAFRVVWRLFDGPDQVQPLKQMAIQGFQDSMLRLKDVRSRDRSIRETSTAISHYRTRLQSTKGPLITELKGSRELIGQGGFGKVYKTIDAASGYYFAVKVVYLPAQPGVLQEEARTAIHREIKIMEKLQHNHIIELLGTKDFHTDQPLIYMHLRDGSLDSLVKGLDREPSGRLCSQVMNEMLRALDYLASRNLCHRDVKPPNILYELLGPDEYRFQLADFGLANYFQNAVTRCGTKLYAAPEVSIGGFDMEHPQTPKMDIWSLFVTMLEILPDIKFPPKNWPLLPPIEIVHAVKDVAKEPALQPMTKLDPRLRPMARLDPKLRASAAQMLIALYNDEQGLTTPMDQIPPIEPDAPEQIPLIAAPPRPSLPPVLEYPRRRGRQPPRPAAAGMLRHGVKKPPPQRRKAKQPRDTKAVEPVAAQDSDVDMPDVDMH